MKFEKLLRFAKTNRASDLILKSGSPPVLRIFGEIKPVEARPLTDSDIQEFLLGVIGEEEFRLFRKGLERDVAVTIPDLGRFRINVFQQRRRLGTVLRLIDDAPPPLQTLHLPQVVRDVAMRERGLVLVTGAAGSGKTTTIASMIQFRAERDACHIISVEDPIEYIIQSENALVDQRQLGRDTHSFANALRHALRQDPDVIVVGEMRDLDTIQMAITAAETGHLVISTLHTVDAVRTIDRIIDVFPSYQQRQVRLQLSANLIGVISQTLVRNIRKDNFILAAEILIATGAIQNLIREGKTYMIGSMVQTGGDESMRTMNRAFYELIQKRMATYEECLARSPNPEELEKLMGKRATLMETLLQGGNG